MKIKSKRDRKNGWTSGTVNHGEYKFEAKVYETPSQFGVHNGKVSKLGLRDEDGRLIADYDRHWEIKPKSSKDQMVFYAVVEHLDNSY